MCDEDPRVADQLREKIKSKMDVAKFFTGFITLLIAFLLDTKTLTTLVAKIGILCLISSLGFCVAAMFTYDHLLWPNGWSPESRGVKISEARFHKYLQTNMVGLWKSLFLPAVGLFGFGFFLLLIEEFGLANCNAYRENTSNLRTVFLWVALCVAFVLPGLFCLVRWPRTNKGNKASATDSGD